MVICVDDRHVLLNISQKKSTFYGRGSSFQAEMEAHSAQVLNGIAGSMAPASLKKASSFEAVRLASQERVQQRLRPGLRAADGGSVGGSAEDGVSADRQPSRSGDPGANFCKDRGYRSAQDLMPESSRHGPA